MATQEEIARQLSLLMTHRRTLAHYLSQQATLGAAYVPPGVVYGIREARSNIQRIKQILRNWHISVADHPDDVDELSQPLPLEKPSSHQTSVDRVKLRQILIDYFNEDELRDLCFDLSIDYENLPGANKVGKARELIAFVERHGRFQELVEHTQYLRPNITW
jgi:hypothetical protein